MCRRDRGEPPRGANEQKSGFARLAFSWKVLAIECWALVARWWRAVLRTGVACICAKCGHELRLRDHGPVAFATTMAIGRFLGIV
jgi:hypothetical protein